MRTPGTRLDWTDASEWLERWREVNGRRSSAARYRARDAHLEALSTAVVEDEPSLEVLEELRTVYRSEGPVPGKRAAWTGVAILDAIDRRRTRLLALRKAIEAQDPRSTIR